MQLDRGAGYDVEELWSHAKVGIDDVVEVPGKDVKVFRFKKI